MSPAGKEKAHKHKQFCPVIAWVRGSPDRMARGQTFMCCVRNRRNIVTRPGGSVTGVTQKLFMCQMLPFLALLLKQHPLPFFKGNSTRGEMFQILTERFSSKCTYYHCKLRFFEMNRSPQIAIKPLGGWARNVLQFKHCA